MITVPPALIAGISRLVQAAGLVALAYLLGRCRDAGTLIYLGGGIGSGQLRLVALAGAWGFLLGSSVAMVPWFSGLVRHGVWRWSAGILGTAASCLALALLAGYGFIALLSSGPGYEKVSAPAGEHTLLVNNRSFLLLGTHVVYEQQHGPVYVLRDTVLTDDGYDPFGTGAFSVQWGRDSATISYAVQSPVEEGDAAPRDGRAVIPFGPG